MRGYSEVSDEERAWRELLEAAHYVTGQMLIGGAPNGGDRLREAAVNYAGTLPKRKKNHETKSIRRKRTSSDPTPVD